VTRTALALLCTLACSASAADWPQWRGPALNGSSPETGLPTTWSKTENVAWVAPMPGAGSSTPIVWGQKVFVSSLDKANQSVVALCLDAKTGKTLWSRRVAKDVKLRNNNAAGPSPVTDGSVVIFTFGTTDVAAFDLDGAPLWQRNLDADFGDIVVQYGYTASPLLHQGRLVFAVLQNKSPTAWGRKSDRKGPLPSFLFAADPRTGKTLWKALRPTDATLESPEAYNTPIPCEHKGRSELILVGGEYVTGHAADSGKELWRWEFSPHDRQVWQRTVPSAVCYDGLILVSRPKHRPLFALEAGGSGRLDDDAIAWQYADATPDVITPLFYQGRLYSMNDKDRIMVCHDPKTGKVIWKEKLGLGNVVRASPTGADGKVYIINRSGDAVVLEAGDTFKVLARIRMGEQPVHSTIAVAYKSLYIRTAENLYCIRK